MSDPVVETKDLTKYYPLKRSILDRLESKKRLQVRAVDGISVAVGTNETLGLVGESGSGKSTLGRTIVFLEKPTSGSVKFRGQDVTSKTSEEIRQLRKQMQIVFQNPNTSLDPRQRVKDIVSEPLRSFKRDTRKDTIDSSVIRVLETVGLGSDTLMRFPHEFSGGQRQRIAIARALILSPNFIVLDEPTSALDSSVQAPILNLLQKIQKELGLSYLFISHNVSVVRYMADRVAVMYSGKIVEVGETREMLEHPLHPYTQTLISSIPRPDPDQRLDTLSLGGEVPSSVNPPPGCRFNPRCPYAEAICKTTEPALREITPRHWSACHFSEKFVDQKSK
jgi:oligopeptide/dipeptide ABC transporter ATP-binding protein